MEKAPSYKNLPIIKVSLLFKYNNTLYGSHGFTNFVNVSFEIRKQVAKMKGFHIRKILKFGIQIGIQLSLDLDGFFCYSAESAGFLRGKQLNNSL